MVANINKGICQSRLQNNQPSFFVNWQENGEQNYKFFSSVYSMYKLFNNLRNGR